MSAATTGTKPYYYVPQPSHWPVVGSVALLLMGMGAAFWFNHIAAGPWMVAAGFAVHLSKPADYSELIAAIAGVATI